MMSDGSPEKKSVSRSVWEGKTNETHFFCLQPLSDKRSRMKIDSTADAIFHDDF